MWWCDSLSLEDVEKEALCTTAKERMKNLRKNLDDVEEEVHRTATKKRMKNVAKNLRNVEK